MPERKLPSLRIALARMAQTSPPLSGRIELHVDGGVCNRIKPVHALPDDFAWIPVAVGSMTPAQEAALESIRKHLHQLHAYHIDCHLILDVVDGVPVLPVRIEYIDSSQPRRAS